jgi:hypothetical protein
MPKTIKFPKVIPRRPYIEEEPDGYLEGDRDWFENNREAARWFLENRDMLEKAFTDMRKTIRDLTTSKAT